MVTVLSRLMRAKAVSTDARGAGFAGGGDGDPGVQRRAAPPAARLAPKASVLAPSCVNPRALRPKCARPTAAGRRAAGPARRARCDPVRVPAPSTRGTSWQVTIYQLEKLDKDHRATACWPRSPTSRRSDLLAMQVCHHLALCDDVTLPEAGLPAPAAGHSGSVRGPPRHPGSRPAGRPHPRCPARTSGPGQWSRCRAARLIRRLSEISHAVAATGRAVSTRPAAGRRPVRLCACPRKLRRQPGMCSSLAPGRHVIAAVPHSRQEHRARSPKCETLMGAPCRAADRPPISRSLRAITSRPCSLAAGRLHLVTLAEETPALTGVSGHCHQIEEFGIDSRPPVEQASVPGGHRTSPL